MRARITVALVALVVSLAPSAFAQHEGHADAEAAIEALNAKFQECWANADAAACASVYTEDAESVDPMGRVSKGRAAIEAGMVETFEQFGDSKISLENQSVHVVNDNLVVADGTWSVTDGADGMPTSGFFTMFVTQVDGEWLVAADQAKVAPPAPE